MRLILSAGAGILLLLIFPAISYDATINIRLSRHPSALALSDDEGAEILRQVQGIICGAFAGATGTKEPCVVAVKPTGDHIALLQGQWIALAKSGRMTAEAIDKLSELAASYGTEVRTADVHVVRAITGCPPGGSRFLSRTIVGCTLRHDIFVVLTPDATRDEIWTTRQAQILAHELGHFVGLPDLHKTSQRTRLMYEAAAIDNVALYPDECRVFDIYPRMPSAGIAWPPVCRTGTSVGRIQSAGMYPLTQSLRLVAH